MKINHNYDYNNISKNNSLPLKSNSKDFRQVMDGIISIQELNFSKHASTRLNTREIELSGEQLARVEAGVNRCASKGIRDSLVLVDNIALVVNISNKVVVTALNQSEQVFTNIDGAVIV